MKKVLSIVASLLALVLVLTACSSKTSDKKEDKKEDKTIKVAAHVPPFTDMLELVKEDLQKEGYTLEIVKVSDNVQANVALANKEIDANFFQHVPYMDEFAKAHNLPLVSVGGVHLEPMGLYSRQIKDLKDLPKGAKIAIPNDPTNGGRALLLLQKAGLITLKDSNNILSTVQDIATNPNGYQFVELEAAQVPRSLDDVALAAVNTNFALNANLNPAKDALFIEANDSPYVNIVTVLKGNENDPRIQKLMAALHSPKIKKFIQDKYQGAILPAF